MCNTAAKCLTRSTPDCVPTDETLGSDEMTTIIQALLLQATGHRANGQLDHAESVVKLASKVQRIADTGGMVCVTPF